MVLLATRPKLTFYQSNTQDIKIFGVIDNDTGLYWNSASIAATMLDLDGNPIPECTAVVLTYQTATNGDYVGTFGDNNFTPAIGTGYTLVIDGDQGPAHLHLEIPVEIKARQS